MGMPIRAERQAPPPPSALGLAWPSSEDERSGAEQSPGSAANDPKRAEQCQPAPRTLMDLWADGDVPEPSATALGLVAWTTDDHGPGATYQLLLATAVTVLERETAGDEARRGADAMKSLYNAGLTGALTFKGKVDRPNEARPFA